MVFLKNNRTLIETHEKTEYRLYLNPDKTGLLWESLDNTGLDRFAKRANITLPRDTIIYSETKKFRSNGDIDIIDKPILPFDGDDNENIYDEDRGDEVNLILSTGSTYVDPQATTFTFKIVLGSDISIIKIKYKVFIYDNNGKFIRQILLNDNESYTLDKSLGIDNMLGGYLYAIPVLRDDSDTKLVKLDFPVTIPVNLNLPKQLDPENDIYFTPDESLTSITLSTSASYIVELTPNLGVFRIDKSLIVPNEHYFLNFTYNSINYRYSITSSNPLANINLNIITLPDEITIGFTLNADMNKHYGDYSIDGTGFNYFIYGVVNDEVRLIDKIKGNFGDLECVVGLPDDKFAIINNRDELKILNYKRLDKEVFLDIIPDVSGKPSGLLHDPTTNSLFITTELGVYKYTYKTRLTTNISDIDCTNTLLIEMDGVIYISPTKDGLMYIIKDDKVLPISDLRRETEDADLNSIIASGYKLSEEEMVLINKYSHKEYRYKNNIITDGDTHIGLTEHTFSLKGNIVYKHKDTTKYVRVESPD